MGLVNIFQAKLLEFTSDRISLLQKRIWLLTNLPAASNGVRYWAAGRAWTMIGSSTKIEARKMLENGDGSPPSGAHCVSYLLDLGRLVLEPINTILDIRYHTLNF